MKIVDTQMLLNLTSKAKATARGRSNLNLHPTLSDPVQRFLNAIEPGSYVRPHRHRIPQEKWELFVVLSGGVVVLVLDDTGKVLDRVELEATGQNRAVEIPPGAWHTLAEPTPARFSSNSKRGPILPWMTRISPHGHPPKARQAAQHWSSGLSRR